MDPAYYGYEAQHGATPDTSETVQISSLALLKMMKHGRAGIPLEVMGLMLGEFVDEYNVRVVDVFAMPQTGTGVTVEAVDPVFQANMMETLKITGRHETVVGWYHSHPGFGCWLSSTDVSTQALFEQICKRAVAVVIDPIQSVKGKVVIDAFRNISHNTLGGDPRITTSNIGFLKQPSFISLVHGLNKNYYSFNITFKKNDLERRMLLNMHRQTWAETLKPGKKVVAREPPLAELAERYVTAAAGECELSAEEREAMRVGRVDNRRHLVGRCREVVEDEVEEALLQSVHAAVFR